MPSVSTGAFASWRASSASTSSPDTAFDNTVFHRHHETGFGSPANRLNIEWLYPAHVNNTNGQALERSRSLVRRCNHVPKREDRNIGPFPHQTRHARLVGFGLVGNGHAARLAARIAHRERPAEHERGMKRIHEFRLVGGAQALAY